MRASTLARWIALGGVLVAFFAALAFSPGAGPRSAEATSNPLPPLIACPNVDADTTVDVMFPGTVGKVTVADILSVVQHFGKNYGTVGYSPLWDLVSPYNSTSPSGTGATNVADILYVVSKFGNHCSLVDTQIAIATRALSDPMFKSKYCDEAGGYTSDMASCGGDPQFFTENVSFLTSKGYLRGSTDVPGQGIHYVNMGLWTGLFNPARPPGLVYKGGALVAQLYFADGDSVGWSPNQTSNVRAVNTDSFCTPVAGEPNGTGCGWSGTADGWHWHANLCTWGIGTPSAVAFPLPPGSNQSTCASYASSAGSPCTAFYPAAGWNCTFKASVGYMGHLWNWLPNANYTNAVNPGPGGLNDCQTAYCNATEANGRFADCFPDVNNWNAYSCPQ
jgi:hypothetical protein